MNNFLKSKALHWMVLVMLVMCLSVLSACGEAAVNNIAISDTNRPRVTYVQGQDLDLSKGNLTVIRDGDVSDIPLNAEGVSISGYNKDQLGKQTLTVTYKDKTVTFDVHVVARMVVENQEANYFVGDSFKKNTGRVKLAKDDGTFSYIDLSSSNVTISEFDSSKAGTVQVKVVCNDAGATYETTFPVTVHEVGEIVFTRPTKTTYQSHEKELVLTGGYLTVNSASDASFSQFVDITANMVTGYDPSAATRENRTQGLKQTITVAYGGKTFQYEISVLYGAVSLVQDNAKLLENLNFSGENVSITPEQGAAAIEAVAEYFNMTKFDKELISEKTLKTIVFPAALMLTQKLYEASEPFSQSFTLNADGHIALQAKSYEQMILDREKLMNPDEEFNQIAILLHMIQDTFGDMKVNDDTTVKDLITVPPAEELNFFVGLFDFLTSLYGSISEVPDNWTLDDLRAYGEHIEVTVYMMQIGGFIGPDFDYVYRAVSAWRTNDDMFDIIYNYYLYIAEDGHDFIREVLWQQLPLTSQLQEWYRSFYNAVVEAQYMANNGETGAYLRDTTAFMYHYYNTLELAENIKNNGRQLDKDLYECIRGDLYMMDNIVLVAGGYVNHSNGLVDSEAYEQLWAKYLAVFNLYVDGTYDVAAHKDMVEDMLDALVKLNAVEVFEFLSSLQYNYIEAGGTYHAFDYTSKTGNSFIAVLVNHFNSTYSEEIVTLFSKLMLAMEDYAIYAGVQGQDVALENFRNNMAEIRTAVAALSAEDKAAFDAVLGAGYDKYNRIYEAILDSNKPMNIPSELMDKINALHLALKDSYAVYAHMSQEGLDQNELRFSCIQLFAAYEKAKQLYNELNACGNADVITLLNTKVYDFGTVQETMETSFSMVRNNFITWMFFGLRFDQRNDAGEVVSTLPAWYLYNDSPVESFLQQAADLLLAGFNGTTKSLDREYVASVNAALMALDEESFFLLYGMGIQRYLDCIASYYRETIQDEATETLAISLLNTQFGYVVYHAMGYQERELTYFKQQFEASQQMLEELTDTTEYELYLKAMYEFYQNYYKSLQ